MLMDCGADWSRSSPDPAHPTFGGALPYLGSGAAQGTDGTIRSDLYSLGVLLYHLVTNDFPVHAKTLRDLQRSPRARRDTHASRICALISKGHFVRVVERAIERDPARRFTSAGEMEAALAQSTGRARTKARRPTSLLSTTGGDSRVGEAPPIFPKPGETLGHYQILEQIGAGGTGVVYRASGQAAET